jgi:splicing factor 3B subunit 3
MFIFKEFYLIILFQVLAMSSRTWLSYTYQGRFHLTPLSYESLEHASGFASEQCPEGIVAIAGNTLR